MNLNDVKFRDIKKKYIFNHEYIPESGIRDIQNKINKVIIEYYNEDMNINDIYKEVIEGTNEEFETYKEEYEKCKEEFEKTKKYQGELIDSLRLDFSSSEIFDKITEKIHKNIRIGEYSEDDFISIEDLVQIKEIDIIRYVIKYMRENNNEEYNKIYYLLRNRK